MFSAGCLPLAGDVSACPPVVASATIQVCWWAGAGGRWAEGRSRKKTFPWREGLAFQDAVAWHLIQH